jgi:hypothetical protein
MAEKVIQCCYSNVLSETGAAGWRVVATSSDVSDSMAGAYAKIQDANVCSNEPLDRDGNSLNMYELVTDRNYVYVTRITYGLMVPGGRKNNMLSHTYLFPIADGVLEDPNTFLTLTDENFTGDIEIAKNVRTDFARSDAYTMDSAMAACGLNQELFLQLIYCMYGCKEQKRTLFIHTNRGDEVIRPLLYLVLSSIPFSMRKNFSCAGELVNENSIKTIVFSTKHMPDELYYDLETGENNVLDTRAIKKYGRWGYVDFYAKNYAQVDGNRYFEKLEEIAIKLGDEKASKNKILQIAHQIIFQGENPETDFDVLRTKLYELLLAPVAGSEYLYDYMADYLERINATGNRLDDEVEEQLISKLDEDVTPRLEKAGEQYMINRITHLSVSEGASILASLSGKKFDLYVTELLKSGNGDPYVDEYFAEKYELPELSWTQLDRYLDDINRFSVDAMPKTADRWGKECLKLYKQDLMQGVDAQTELAKFEQYSSIFADEESAASLRRKALNIYWDMFTVASYDPKKADEYNAFRTVENGYSECAQHVIEMFAPLKKGDATGFDKLKNKLLENDGTYLTRQDRIHLYEIFEEMLEHFPQNDAAQFIKKITYLDFMINIKTNHTCVDLCGYLNKNEMDTFEAEYQKLVNQAKANREISEDLQNALSYCLFYRMEKKNLISPKTLDVLLIVGRTMYENPFTIFDHLEEAGVPNAYLDVICVNPEIIFENSTLLKQSEIIDLAGEYLEDESEYGEYIWEWTDVYKKNQRALKKANRENDFKATVGRFFGRK